MCFGRVSSSCSTSGTYRVHLVTNPVIGRDIRIWLVSDILNFNYLVHLSVSIQNILLFFTVYYITLIFRIVIGSFDLNTSQTTQWPKKRTEGQTTIYKTYMKNSDRVTRNPLKPGGELRCFGRVSSSMWQHSNSTCIWSIYLSDDTIFQGLWFLSGFP
jgi:hypothetical protein